MVKLSGLKFRVTELRLRKIVAASEGVVFSNVVTNVVTLLPGRYAVIPYTHCALSRAAEYVLHFNYLGRQVEFEVEDVLEQRLVDDAPSYEDDHEDQPDDNDLLHLHEGGGGGVGGNGIGSINGGEGDDVSIMSYEEEKVVGRRGGDDDIDFNEEDEEEDYYDGGGEDGSGQGRRAKSRPAAMVAPPKLLLYKPWEYAEDSEELGVQQVFGEVGDIMKYVRTLRGEVRKLHATIRALHPYAAGPGERGGGATAAGGWRSCC